MLDFPARVIGRILLFDRSGLDRVSRTIGNWTISGSDMYSGVTGNVGIGTAAPSSLLEVSGGDFVARGRIVGHGAFFDGLTNG